MKKTLTAEEADVVLRIEMMKRFPTICEKFLRFLKVSVHKAINFDQWVNLIDVFKILSRGEVYDPTSSCMEKL